MIRPLVSIVVITYNSSEFIIAGLESIKNQTYDNIELIISDDCSTDDTVEICSKWLKENESNFKRVKLVTTTRNTGVAGNLNRGIKEARGEWIKTLSGDDKFFPKTVECYIDYIKKNKNADIVFGKFFFFGPDDELVKETKIYYEKQYYPKIKLSQKKQYREHLKRLFIPSPGLIFKKDLYEKVDGYDERYQFCEEDPFIYKILKKGYHVHFLDEEVYGYQIRSSSLCRESKDKSEISRHVRDRIKFFKDIRKSELLQSGLILHLYDLMITYALMEAYVDGLKYKILLYKLLSYFSPLADIKRFRNLKEKLRRFLLSN